MQQYQTGNGQNGNIGSPPLYVGSFQQPFVPQDLWQMPMTLEWDWADIVGNGGVNGDGTANLGGHGQGMANGGFQTSPRDNAGGM